MVQRAPNVLTIMQRVLLVLVVLAKERKALIQVGDKARNVRKQHSQQIFQLMQAKQEEQANELKAQVEAVNKVLS